MKLGVNWSDVDLDSVFMHLKSLQFPIFLEFKDQYENSLLIGMNEKYSFLLFDVYHLENPMDHWIEYAKSFFEDLEEYETIESRTIQKNFREFMRINQIVEHLENNDENV